MGNVSGGLDTETPTNNNSKSTPAQADPLRVNLTPTRPKLDAKYPSQNGDKTEVARKESYKNPFPARQPCPVGIHIQDELEARGIDVEAFIKELWQGPCKGVLITHIQIVIMGGEEEPMTPQIAFGLEIMLGIRAEFWMALQAARDLWPLRKAYKESQKGK